MLKLLKLLLTYQFRNSQPSRKNSGFTLIELLVGLILAFLVIIPLLGFMVNLLNTDRQEQAKANTEQEIQAALNYISRDLDQAVYIYDGYGVDQISDQLPQVDNGVPVLVFWKRQFIRKVIPTASGVDCPDDRCDDAFVYALVAYYLEHDPTCATTSTWSCTARISRIQLRDAVEKGAPGDDRAQKDDGFALFDPQAASSVEGAMNAWEKGDEAYNKKPEVLIDYIDQTPETAQTLADPIKLPKASCPSIQRTTPPPDTTLTSAAYTNTDFGPQQSPSKTALTNNEFTNPITGFYACVDTERNSAQVFIRGNALARIKSKTSPPTYVYSQHTYFPKGSIQVKKRGLFTIQKGGS